VTSHSQSWDSHYTRHKSALFYPDENLVRMLKPYVATISMKENLVCLDMGCGSGRHIALAGETGIGTVIGMDISYNGLEIARNFGSPLIQADGSRIPFKNGSIDIVITWGSLHYSPKKDLPTALDEIYRVMKKGSVLFGTLRCNRDTMLKKGKDLGNDEWITNLSDIENSIVSFYSEYELKKYFSQFGSFLYGRMERTLLGDIDKIISHWYFRAFK
jgi:ubiquinone/menaquinone biosynthesis C-methylase UbiE